MNGIITKINNKLKKNLSYINSILVESILFDDSQLKYKINAKIDDTLNFVWYEIYKKNRKNRKNIISSLEVNTDKIDILKKMYDLSYDIIYQTFVKILIFANTQFLWYWKGMDEVRLLNSEIKKFMIQLKQNLTNIFNKENLL